ncbi:MAG: Mu transposase domain-containing protein [Terriglobia bacterium]
MSVNEIVRRLRISRNTVRTILKQQGEMPVGIRKDKILIDAELLERLYGECDGWVERVHEKLAEEEGISIAYSTLTRLVRERGLGEEQADRCDRVPDEPGAEMQHDTSPYGIRLGDTPVKLIASLIYLRYSKRRYLKFFRSFNRFRMKCFLHQALMFWGYAAGVCVIDNTNLARLKGTGRNAVMVPEMAEFAREHGFGFLCHEKGHANRKAGEERSFWTVETNFFPGRHFSSLEDLNQQALEWAMVRMEHRPAAKTGLIPAQGFEQERAALVPLPAHLPAPYLHHERKTDQYGYVPFDGNYYWVPKTQGIHSREVKVLEYSERLQIYQNRECVAKYVLPAEGVKNRLFSPQGMPGPVRQPRNRKRPTEEEEKRLRALSPTVGNYLDFVLASRSGMERHHFLRELFAWSERLTPALFLPVVERALRYGISDLGTLERIARLSIRQGGEMPLPGAEVDERFQDRETYQQGRLTDAPDFSGYDQLLEEPEEEEENDG